jgi:N-acetylglucosaminyl-diphospho-decaprenol L-rhamnosyltransferase
MNSSQQNKKMLEEVTVIIVSYNTRDLTLKALETLYANAGNVRMQVIVWDNASADSSADAIAAAYPEAELIRSPDNLGFAVANNRAAELARADWLLLLNPDTETYPRAVEAMLEFAKAHPEAGIVGGRTYFPDGSLNPQSCWNRITPWSLFCSATGLTRVFGNTTLFNPEGIGGWQRDTVRHVDIVVGCFLMIPTRLWRELGGFRDKYFMYGEEADLCLRAAKAGYRPMITPDAQIMHLVGASTPTLAPKLLRMTKARVTLVRDHWSPSLQPLGLALMLLWSFNHWLQSRLERAIKGQSADNDAWVVLWQKRQEWLGGYS